MKTEKWEEGADQRAETGAVNACPNGAPATRYPMMKVRLDSAVHSEMRSPSALYLSVRLSLFAKQKRMCRCKG
jgi:hypothetical protein